MKRERDGKGQAVQLSSYNQGINSRMSVGLGAVAAFGMERMHKTINV